MVTYPSSLSSLAQWHSAYDTKYKSLNQNHIYAVLERKINQKKKIYFLKSICWYMHYIGINLVWKEFSNEKSVTFRRNDFCMWCIKTHNQIDTAPIQKQTKWKEKQKNESQDEKGAILNNKNKKSDNKKSVWQRTRKRNVNAKFKVKINK